MPPNFGLATPLTVWLIIFCAVAGTSSHNMYSEKDETHSEDGDQYKTTRFNLEIDSHLKMESIECVKELVKTCRKNKEYRKTIKINGRRAMKKYQG